MKIEALDSTGEYFSVIVIEHNGEKLEWNTNDYEREMIEVVIRYLNISINILIIFH